MMPKVKRGESPFWGHPFLPAPRSRSHLSVTYFFCFFAAAVISLSPFSAAAIELEQLSGIPNAKLLEGDIVGGGTPSESALQTASLAGVRTVIDLRTPEEGTAAEAKLVKKYGMTYFNIPIVPGKVTRQHVDALHWLLSNSENRPALLHCASGGRVSQLWSLYRKEKVL